MTELEAIQKNGEVLDELRATVARQSHDLLHLRATIDGLVEVLVSHVGFGRDRFARAVEAAWEELVPPAPPKLKKSLVDEHPPTDPYRNAPVSDPVAEAAAEAKELLRTAQDHHFHKRFAEARAVYQDIVLRYGETKSAVVARQQLVNLQDL